MRSKAIIFILLGFAAMFNSCDDLLTENPYSSITTASFFKSELDAETAVNGIYAGMQQGLFANTMLYMVEVPGMYGTTRNQWRYKWHTGWNLTPSDPEIRNYVRMRYDVLNRANYVIKYVAPIQMNEAKRNALIAEARWIRAYICFDLVRMFGDFVIMTEPAETADQVRLAPTSALDIYNNIIIPDLEFAAEHLPVTSSAPGRLRRGAAPFLLGKVYLTMARNPINDVSKLQLAKQYLQDVVNNHAAYGYRMMNRYLDVFPITEDMRDFDGSKELNDELVFVIQHTRAAIGHGQGLTARFLPLDYPFIRRPAPPATGGAYFISYLEPLYNLYEASDERRDVTLIHSFPRASRPAQTVVFGQPISPGHGYSNKLNGICLGKYQDVGAMTAGDGQSDVIIYRLSDAHLMLAETENLINGGPNALVFDMIDVVRLRAKATPVDRSAAWTMQSMDDFILDERCMEFAGEFHGIFDVRRFGKTREKIEKLYDLFGQPGYTHAAAYPRTLMSYDPKIELYPIPTEELERNPLATQNPGW